MSSSENGFANNGSSNNDNSNNSFYASFKIYINKFSGAGSSSTAAGSSATTGNSTQSQPKPILRNPNKIVRIERIECVDEEDSVFFEPTKTTQNVEVQIKVDPPQSNTSQSNPSNSGLLRNNRENSPVFYLEPDDWHAENKTPPMVTSPTRALSPCGCGKSHSSHHMTHMESLPEEGLEGRSSSLRAFSTSSFGSSTSEPPVRSSSGTYLTLPSPRAAIMSEIMQSNKQQQRQRKIAIPVLCARAVNSAVRTLFGLFRGLGKSPRCQLTWQKISIQRTSLKFLFGNLLKAWCLKIFKNMNARVTKYQVRFVRSTRARKETLKKLYIFQFIVDVLEILESRHNWMHDKA